MLTSPCRTLGMYDSLTEIVGHHSVPTGVLFSLECLALLSFLLYRLCGASEFPSSVWPHGVPAIDYRACLPIFLVPSSKNVLESPRTSPPSNKTGVKVDRPRLPYRALSGVPC